MIDKWLKTFKYLWLLWILQEIAIHLEVAAQTSQNINVCKSGNRFLYMYPSTSLR